MSVAPRPGERADLARRIHVAAHRRGRFVLRSGAISDEYFDKYRFEADPVLLRDVARALAALVPAGAQAIAGLELGGVPLAVVVSQETGLATRFVRKQAKEHGTRELAEGGDVQGVRLAVVEDVITSGGQVVASCADLRERGAEISTVLCVIDREAGGREALADAGLPLRALFTASDLRAAGRTPGQRPD